MKKTKIVLDADVIIHFIKAGRLSFLPQIFPEYEYILLDVVYNELKKNRNTQILIDNYTRFFSDIKIISFKPSGESTKEYFNLLQTLGKGESACMVYCKYNQDVLGSSNLRDIKEYCAKNKITYLTTLDFLFYAYSKKIMTAKECTEFIQAVIQSGSKLPLIDIRDYRCSVIL